MAVATTEVQEDATGRPLKSYLGSANARNGNIVWLVLFSDAFNEQQPSAPQSEVNGADSKSFTRAHVGKSDDGGGRNVTLRSIRLPSSLPDVSDHQPLPSPPR